MLQKIEKILLFLLMLLLPSQLSYHWWPEWSFVNGVRVDYLSPTLYLTDIFIAVLLGIFFLKRPAFNINRTYIAFSVIAFLNIFYSTLPWLSFIKWVRLFELFLLARYLIANREWTRTIVLLGLSWAVVWTAILSAWQFIVQGSVGGAWYWLGERSFGINTPGISKVFIENLGLVVRPYATLPHPNALGGWLLLALVTIGEQTPRSTKYTKIITYLGILGIGLSLSRSAIIASVIAAHLLVSKFSKSVNLMTGILIGIFLVVIVPGNPSSLIDRQVLFEGAWKTFQKYTLFGTGLGASVKESVFVFQPVHNIFMLLLVELGILLFLVLVSLVIWSLANRKIVIRENNVVRAGIVVVLVTGLVDHYWISLWQNILLLTIFIATIAVELPHGRISNILRRGS